MSVLQQWNEEWDMLVKMAANDLQYISGTYYGHYKYLEQIHVFVLANILRRPIIVLGEPFVRGISGDTIEHNDFVGIYLPLLFQPTECFKLPIVLVHIDQHFMPLLILKSDASSKNKRLAVNLVTADLEPLRIHFLLPQEGGLNANVILQKYLAPVEIETSHGDGTNEAISVLCALYTYPMEHPYMTSSEDDSEACENYPYKNHRSSPIQYFESVQQELKQCKELKQFYRQKLCDVAKLEKVFREKCRGVASSFLKMPPHFRSHQCMQILREIYGVSDDYSLIQLIQNHPDNEYGELYNISLFDVWCLARVYISYFIKLIVLEIVVQIISYFITRIVIKNIIEILPYFITHIVVEIIRTISYFIITLTVIEHVIEIYHTSLHILSWR